MWATLIDITDLHHRGLQALVWRWRSVLGDRILALAVLTMATMEMTRTMTATVATIASRPPTPALLLLLTLRHNHPCPRNDQRRRCHRQRPSRDFLPTLSPHRPRHSAPSLGGRPFGVLLLCLQIQICVRTSLRRQRKSPRCDAIISPFSRWRYENILRYWAIIRAVNPVCRYRSGGTTTPMQPFTTWMSTKLIANRSESSLERT